MNGSAVGRVWNPGVMSSLRHDWATPRQLFEMLDKEFHFTLDACATADTTTCKHFIADGALERIWVPTVHSSGRTGAIWVNPPYGRKIGDWIEKAFRESIGCGRQINVVMLLPARTDTQWFHEYCLKGEIRFLRGRLSFDDSPRGRCPFPSMIVVFRGGR